MVAMIGIGLHLRLPIVASRLSDNGDSAACRVADTIISNSLRNLMTNYIDKQKKNDFDKALTKALSNTPQRREEGVSKPIVPQLESLIWHKPQATGKRKEGVLNF